MIRYTLRCSAGHRFDSWFRSSDVFDAMQHAGQISCTTCGVNAVEKAPMAPALAPREVPAPQNDTTQVPSQPGRKLPAEPEAAERKLAALRAHIEANSDYVGPRFASEARAIHEGRAPHRSIHGEARLDEARKLIKDGVPVAPLPFVPRRKLN